MKGSLKVVTPDDQFRSSRLQGGFPGSVFEASYEMSYGRDSNKVLLGSICRRKYVMSFK